MTKNLDQVKKEYRGKIDEDYKKLKRHFKKNRFAEMAEILGDNTILVSPEGERLQGIACVKKFWEKEKAYGATDVNFESKGVFVYKVKRVVEKPEPGETVVHASHEITAFKLITEVGGEIQKNCDGSWGRSDRHQDSCVWEP